MADAFSRERDRKLGRLFHGELSPYDVRRWFASTLWEAERSADDDTLAFAYRIENIIAERSGSHISDHEMIAALHTAARQRSTVHRTVVPA